MTIDDVILTGHRVPYLAPVPDWLLPKWGASVRWLPCVRVWSPW